MFVKISVINFYIRCLKQYLPTCLRCLNCIVKDGDGEVNAAMVATIDSFEVNHGLNRQMLNVALVILIIKLFKLEL